MVRGIKKSKKYTKKKVIQNGKTWPCGGILDIHTSQRLSGMLILTCDV